MSTPQLGSKPTVDAAIDHTLYRLQRSMRGTNVLTILFLVACLLASLAFGLERSEPLYLWLAVFLFTVAFRFLLDLWGLGGSLSWVVMEELVYVVNAMSFAALWLLLSRLFGLDESRRWPQVTRVATVLLLALSAVFACLVHVVAAWTARTALLFRISWWAFTLIEFYTFVLIAAGLRRKSERAEWAVALASTMAVTIPVVYNIFQLLKQWDFADRTLYTTLFTVFGGTVSSLELSQFILLLALGHAAIGRLRKARRQHLEIELELRSAHEVQEILVPETLPKVSGFALTSAYQPAREVGGDFFQVIPLEDNSTLLVIGDVSGKGLRAGMMVALITGSLRTAAEICPDPAALLRLLNRGLCGRMQGGFVTCLAVRMFPDGQYTLANAGHLGPVVNGQEIDLPGALPLGLDLDAEYVPVMLRLQEGDTLTMFTDGVPEARNSQGDLFGFERTITAMEGRSTAEAIALQACEFGQEDDITVLTVERLARIADLMELPMQVAPIA